MDGQSANPPVATPDAATDDERALVERLKAGDDQAYEHVVRSYSPRLLAVARRLLRNEEDARDALQEAFVSAFRKIDQFEGGAKLSTWLHRIVVNAALMKLRAARRHPTRQIDDLLPRFLDDGHRLVPNSDWQPSGPAVAEQQETRAIVREAIDALPDTHRAVLMLRDIEQLSTAEAAQALGVSENVVKVRLHRARLALREALGQQFAGGAL